MNCTTYSRLKVHFYSAAFGDPTFAPATIAPAMISPATKIRVRVGVIIWLLVQGSVRIRVRVEVGFNIGLTFVTGANVPAFSSIKGQVKIWLKIICLVICHTILICIPSSLNVAVLS